MALRPPADIPLSPSAALLGWRLVEHDAAKGWVRIAFEVRREFLNSAGFVQSGFLAAMLDDSMAPALWLMTNGEFFPATIAMTVCFLDSAAPGALFGEGQVIRYGNTIAFLEGRSAMAAAGSWRAPRPTPAWWRPSALSLRRASSIVNCRTPLPSPPPQGARGRQATTRFPLPPWGG
jgi:uncharacterized protein (TIGR00369 family)